MSAQSPHLLLVDDDPSMIRFVSHVLNDYPNQRFAQCGEDALALARQATPDLILLDANMPGMTGFDVCETLKQDPTLAHVPVIFITSYDAPALKLDAFKLGAADYVAKPIAAADLKARVVAVLEASKLFEKLSLAHVNVRQADHSDASLRPLLVIDGASGAVDTYSSALSALGALRFANSGESGWTSALGDPPAIFIVDADIPDIDALSLCAKIRATTAFQRTPIVFIARNCDAFTEQRAKVFGATAVLSKPLDGYTLRMSVDALLARARQLDD